MWGIQAQIAETFVAVPPTVSYYFAQISIFLKFPKRISGTQRYLNNFLLRIARLSFISLSHVEFSSLFFALAGRLGHPSPNR